MNPKITVYIPSYNYAGYLEQAVQSVLDQSYSDFELFIIDDGSEDETFLLAKRLESKDPARIRVFQNKDRKGIRFCANLALSHAKGEYFMRLDADDYLDESALLALSDYLDRHAETGLVYPNFILVSEQGEYLGIERRKKPQQEAQLLDLPAHGAVTMIRKCILEEIGGYSEKYEAQDGHELWLNVIDRHAVGNISTPLFYYRQHGRSVSNNQSRLLDSRRSIKKDMAERLAGRHNLSVLAVIPAKNTYPQLPNIVLNEMAGKPLIDYAIEHAKLSEMFDRIVVTTDDPRVVDYCAGREITAYQREARLSDPHVKFPKIIRDALTWLTNTDGYQPDIVAILNVGSPLADSKYIQEALDTLFLFKTESVISVYEDRDILFRHEEYGLKSVNKGMLKNIRLEREALYVDNGAIKVFWRQHLEKEDFYQGKIGHIVMPFEESFQIKNEFDVWMIEQLLTRKRKALDYAAPSNLR